MKMFIAFFLSIFLLSACQQQDPAATVDGKVYASPAYLQHFGEPPAVQQGHAYAQVGYLPLNDLSGQVQPLPLFLFSEGQHLDRILSQIFSEKLVGSTRSRLTQPFRQGVRLEKLDQAGDTLTVYLSELPSSQNVDRVGIDRAIAETAIQFEDVSKVRVVYNGSPSPHQPLEGYLSQSEKIVAVEAPLLLDVVGIWEEGATDPEELLINFDRPITINSFRLLDQAGKQIAGKYFTSILDMAVVVHPAEPAKFKEGIPLNVVWDVDDHLGRRNSAIDTLPLTRSAH